MVIFRPQPAALAASGALVDLRLHEKQWEVHRCGERFRVLVAGRQFGKTHLALAEMLKFGARRAGGLISYVAPGKRQAKEIAWERLKEMSQPLWGRKRPNEDEMRITLQNGATLMVTGARFPDALRGQVLDFAVIDEYADIHRDAWVQVLRPALSLRGGHALFIGTPKGRNHFYELYQMAISGRRDWAGFQYTTAQGGLVSQFELDCASSDSDEETFRQEYEAQFTSMGLHRVYQAFTHEQNVRAVRFDPRRALIWSVDFNVDPMCMVLMQRVEGDVVHVIDEIVIRPDANTERGCDAFLEKALAYSKQVSYLDSPMAVHVYGDMSGFRRQTSASGSETDWTIIKAFFKKWVGVFRPEYYMATTNPRVRDRVNCVNGRLKSHAGEVRLLIDPKCRELIRDLEDVTWRVGRQGRVSYQINKADLARTHMSDALGYYVSQVFPLRPLAGPSDEGRIYDFG